MNIYIACGLTHVPRPLFAEYADFVHRLARSLGAAPFGHDVKYALSHSDPQLAERPFEERARLCYLWDKRMVEEADLVIGEASFPSTGLGVELQIAETRRIPILLCFRDFGSNHAQPVSYETPDHQRHDLQVGGGFISLMALGVPSVLRVIRYEDSAGGILRVVEAVAALTP